MKKVAIIKYPSKMWGKKSSKKYFTSGNKVAEREYKGINKKPNKKNITKCGIVNIISI